MSSTRKINYAINCCKDVLKSFTVQGMDSVLFNASFYKGGKKLNSIENAETQYFSELMKNYNKTESPDKVKIEFRNGDNNALLWSKDYNLADNVMEPVTVSTGFQGFGEAEINGIVETKIRDYERNRETESLRLQVEELTAENDELRGELEELNDSLEAKKGMEYYANILGMAMPGLAKVLGKSQAGQALGFLSGTEEENQLEAAKPSDNKSTVIQLLNEYMQSLDERTLGKVYLVLCEFSSNQLLIDEVLKTINSKTQNYEQQ